MYFVSNDLAVDETSSSTYLGAVAEWLAYSPSTKVIRVRTPAESPDFYMWESCRTMPLVGRFSRGSPVSPALSFRCCSILASITLACSQYLAVTTLPNLFTHSIYLPPVHVTNSCGFRTLFSLVDCKAPGFKTATGSHVGSFVGVTIMEVLVYGVKSPDTKVKPMMKVKDRASSGKKVHITLKRTLNFPIVNPALVRLAREKRPPERQDKGFHLSRGGARDRRRQAQGKRSWREKVIVTTMEKEGDKTCGPPCTVTVFAVVDTLHGRSVVNSAVLCKETTSIALFHWIVLSEYLAPAAISRYARSRDTHLDSPLTKADALATSLPPVGEAPE
ncbi:hypothetical protein PR048_023198 [Dryococelus australis]|uniref:Uncharacterized protein n=1 Tax=Dryococelus australis TaxID=614101 RepID=A0ABQ9GTF4_9NEOP|nr:hypothetical protein PR048_023198 [Dryococelus australis]